MTGLIWVTDPGRRTLQSGDLLAGPRQTSYRWDVLSLDDVPLGTLDGATGGSLSWSNARQIRGNGQLDWAGVDIPDWLSIRLQPWISLRFPTGAVAEWPLGVYIPATPDAAWAGTGARLSVDLYDKLQVLVDDKIGPAYSVPAGAVVTDRVRALITDAGETKMAITDSTETLRSGMTWEPGTSRLEIINDLLAAINFWSLDMDGYGTYVAAPYVRPQDRDPARVFGEGAERIYTPQWTRELDLFGVPNVMTLVSRGDGDTPALVATARNDDPADPLSTVARGREIEQVEEGVEVTSLTVLQDMAERRLREARSSVSAAQINHAPIPLSLNDVVAFDNAMSNTTFSRAVVQNMSLNLTSAAQMQTRLVEVAA